MKVGITMVVVLGITVAGYCKVQPDPYLNKPYPLPSPKFTGVKSLKPWEPHAIFASKDLRLEDAQSYFERCPCSDSGLA